MASERKYAANTGEMEAKLADYFETWDLCLMNGSTFELQIKGVGSEGANTTDLHIYRGTFTEDDTSVTLTANYKEHKFDREFWHPGIFQRNKHTHDTDNKFRATWKLIKQEINLQPQTGFPSSFLGLLLKPTTK
mmetsp:Transcript_28918/g.40713  ORF Transcript_28918/g.40713 Transcript_28918/m.40713 type:complete len:134 (-) Transcript_28918:23-424(-)